MKPKRRGHFVLSEIEATGESILIDSNNDKATVINEVATIVWLLCDGDRDIASICEEILSNLPAGAVTPETLESDVERVIRGFIEEGIVIG